MPNSDEQVSPSGVPIIRYAPPTLGFMPASGDSDNIDAITRHIEQYIGAPNTVLHEIISDRVHIDVHVVEPTPKRNFYTLITSGMSDLPMNAPPQLPSAQFAELLICLPPNWILPMQGDAVIGNGQNSRSAASEREENYWPIRWLKILAKFPHEYNTWLGEGHTIPNGDPPTGFATNTRLCCMMLELPAKFASGVRTLTTPQGKVINFYALVPLYKDEVNWKLNKSSDDLHARLKSAGVTELLDINRKSVCAKWPWSR